MAETHREEGKFRGTGRRGALDGGVVAVDGEVFHDGRQRGGEAVAAEWSQAEGLTTAGALDGCGQGGGTAWDINGAPRGGQGALGPSCGGSQQAGCHGSSGGPDESAVHESSLHGHEINRTGGFLPVSGFLLYQAEVVIGRESSERGGGERKGLDNRMILAQSGVIGRIMTGSAAGPVPHPRAGRGLGVAGRPGPGCGG